MRMTVDSVAEEEDRSGTEKCKKTRCGKKCGELCMFSHMFD